MSCHHGPGLACLQVILDLAIGVACMFGAYYLALFGVPMPLAHGAPELAQYSRILPLFLGVFLYTAFFYQVYRPRRAGSYLTLALDLVKVNLQSALIILAVLFYAREESYSRIIITNYFALSALFMFLHHTAWLAWERHLYRTANGTRNCLIVGCSNLARSVAERFAAHPWTGLVIRGFASVNGDVNPAVPPERILGRAEQLKELIAAHDIQEVIVAVPFRSMSALVAVDRLLAQSTVGLRWAPDLEAVNTISRDVTDFDGIPLIDLRAVRIKGWSLVLKRLVDVSLSLTLLLICSPLMLLICIGILLRYGWPIFFIQERVGLDGRVFPLYKFRSMKVNAEESTGPVFTRRNDIRVTGLGSFLRRTSLDELPQLWNVLLGQMSIVGPRPERAIFIEEFKKTVPHYMLRHRMKVGVTGWAQVNGWRGDTSIERRIQFDLYYMKNWSLWFDLKILFLTLWRGWGRSRNAY